MKRQKMWNKCVAGLLMTSLVIQLVRPPIGNASPFSGSSFGGPRTLGSGGALGGRGSGTGSGGGAGCNTGCGGGGGSGNVTAAFCLKQRMVKGALTKVFFLDFEPPAGAAIDYCRSSYKKFTNFKQETIETEDELYDWTSGIGEYYTHNDWKQEREFDYYFTYNGRNSSPSASIGVLKNEIKNTSTISQGFSDLWVDCWEVEYHGFNQSECSVVTTGPTVTTTLYGDPNTWGYDYPVPFAYAGFGLGTATWGSAGANDSVNQFTDYLANDPDDPSDGLLNTISTHSWSGNMAMGLENEYTDQELFDDVLAELPSDAVLQAKNWGGAEKPKCGGIPVSLVDRQCYVNLPPFLRLRKCELKVIIHNTKKDHTYELDVKHDGPLNIAPVAGTGGNVEVYLGIFTPISPGVGESVEIGEVTEIPPATNPGNGNGNGSGNGGSGSGGNWTTFGGGRGTELGSFGLNLPLGRATDGRWAGELRIHEEDWSTAILDPASIRHVEVVGTSTVITNTNGTLRQVLAPQTLADIVVDSTNRYHIHFYATSQVGALSGGLYATTGSPLVSWTIENADASGATFNQVNVTETRGASIVLSSYSFDASSSTWTLLKGNGLTKQTKQALWISETNYVETFAVLDPADDSVLSQRQDWYHKFSFGKRLVEVIGGTGAVTNSTRFFFCTDTNAAYYMEPIGTATSDGRWTTNQYSGSTLTAVYSGFGDQTPTTDDNLTRKTVYAYDANGFFSNISEYALGTLVRSTSIGEAPNQRTETVSGLNVSPMATTTTKVAVGDFVGEIGSITRPDGTMSLFEYGRDAATGWRTNTAYIGEPNANGDAIIAGTKKVTVLDQLGVVQSRKSYDIASGILIANQSYATFDDYGRYQQMIDHLGDYTNLVTYICCGIESFTGKDGLTTTYGWDDLKRVTSITRQGITQIRGFDAASRLSQTTRQGTDGSLIVQNTSGYDVLGRMTSTTNAVGDVTGYVYGFDANGRPQTTITYPDFSTRITTFHLDGSLKSVTGTAVHGTRYEYGVNVAEAWAKEIKLLPNGGDSQEWVQNCSDGLGRSIKTVYPDTAESTQHYNTFGQLWKSVDPDGVKTLYLYNGQGQREYSAIDMNGNDVIDFAGTDHITRTVRSFGAAAAFAGDAHISERRVWNEDGVDGFIAVGRSEVAVDGSRFARIAHGLATISETACGANCTATTTYPDGSYVTTVKTNGFVAEVTRYDSQAVQLSSVDYGYDTHGRRKYMIDVRNGTTSRVFDDADRVTAVTTPSPGMGQSPQTVSTFFNNMGRAWRVVQPDGNSVTNEYHLTGELKKTSGARTYPVEYSHDYAGRRKTMTTWQDHVGDSGKAVTIWNYHPQRGWVDSKQYDDGNGLSYTYHPSGKLHTRTWARGTVATYLYNNAGQLSSIDYSDTTPDISYTHNRLGQRTQITQGGITTTKTYTAAGQLETETYTGGPLHGLSITNSYDTLLRRERLQLSGTPNVEPESIFGYDDASRLETVSDGNHTATYSYLANSPLVEQIAFDQSGTTRMISTKAHDFANRLTSIGHADGQATTLASRAYGYNAVNQRTNVIHEDNSYWSFGYDSLGQVSSGKKRNGASQLYPGLQYEFDHDDIGNRTETRTGGDANGGSLRTAKYTPNKLNQYQQREVPGFIEVQGTAAANATVTVNGQTTERLGSFYRKELFADNVGGPLAVGITNTAVIPGGGPGGEDLVKKETGTRFHSSTPEVFSHDADGNLLSDSLWNYTWNGENRLIEQTSNANLPAAQRRKLVFTYDHQGRRISKAVLVWDNITSTYLPLSDVAFVYDGWNLIAEVESGHVKNSFTWGLDLRGSGQRAGGVGGLLFISQVSGAQPSNHFVGCDGNGNVILLADAASGIATAEYEYSPFGKVVRANGPMALINPLRFSTKYQDDDTGFNYYGHRYYNSDTGKWLNRDPIVEQGGENLYGFVANNSVDRVDILGLTPGSTGIGGPSWPGFPGFGNGYPPYTPPPAVIPGTGISLNQPVIDWAWQLAQFLERDGHDPCNGRGYAPGMDTGHFNHCRFGCLFQAFTHNMGFLAVWYTEFDGNSSFQWLDLVMNYHGSVLATYGNVSLTPVDLDYCNKQCGDTVCNPPPPPPICVPPFSLINNNSVPVITIPSFTPITRLGP